MRRREFILALGGAALWPLTGRAQQMLRVGFVGVQPREAALYNNFRRRMAQRLHPAEFGSFVAIVNRPESSKSAAVTATGKS